MSLDLLVLALLAVSALHGAISGALKQIVSLAAVALGWLAARHLTDPVAAGLHRWLPSLLARPAAAGLLFAGTWALVSLLARAVLASRLSGERGPADRGLGALLGGAKGALAAWVLLSALALVGAERQDGILDGRASDFARLARAHNLLRRLDPEKAAQVERLLRAAREAREKGGARAEAGARLLEDPRLRGLADAGGLDPQDAEELLQDPKVRALVERLRAEEARAAER